MEPLDQSLARRALELVQLPSPIGHEAAIADAVEAWAVGVSGRGHVVRTSHSLCVGDVSSPGPLVLLVGHLDTVPPHPAASPARLEGGRLYGRGASDMKGSLAVMMALHEALHAQREPARVALVLYEREEGPYLESGLGPLFEAVPALKRASFAVALEPTDGAVQVGCVGSLHATLRFEGQAAHSARPWQGKNAIHAAGGVLADLQARERRRVVVAGYEYFEVMSATLARGGRARNVVPDAFEVNLNYRFAPGKSVEAAQQDVLALVAGRAQVDFTDLAPSGAVCADNPWFRRLTARTGRPAEAKQAWTDVARLASFGVDAVNYGPGETAQAHQQDESAPVAALGEAYRVLLDVLRGA